MNDHIIDRLVDGELSDSERRDLLLRLDDEPNGWRKCAMAFLEAQSWREAMAGIPGRERIPRRPAQEKRRSTKPTLIAGARFAGLAASIVAAFGLGWSWRGGEPNALQHATGGVTNPIVQPITVAARAPETTTDRPASTSSFIDPVVRRWEQQGFHAERQRRLVVMKLNDGRQVEVPVQEVSLQYMGGRTY